MTDGGLKSLIDPDLYRQTLERLQLRTICLEEVNSFCDREDLEQGGITIGVEEDTFARQTPTKFHAYITYQLTGTQADTVALRLDARFCMIFDTDEPVPLGFFEVFRTLNLKTTTLPYFRELVASITGRMELPTLTLPYNLFIPDDGAEDAALGEDKMTLLPAPDPPA